MELRCRAIRVSHASRSATSTDKFSRTLFFLLPPFREPGSQLRRDAAHRHLVAACAARAELVWENSTQEFQRTPDDRELTVNFAFHNDGKASVTVTKVTSSCGCTTADLAKKTYAPGETGSLAAKFVFGGRRGMQAKSIAVATDDGKTAQLSFQCLIADDPVAVSPALVWWRVGEAAEAKKVDLTLAQSGKIHITAVASTNPRVAATLATVKEGEKYAVNIRPADTAKQESAEVFVQTDFPPEGPRAYTIEVRIK
jgi:hypothetical protein